MNRKLLQQALKLLIAYQDYTRDFRIANKCGSTIQAIEAELANPTLPMSPEHLPQYIATNNIKPTTEGGGGAGGDITQISPDQYERFCFTCGDCLGKPWVGLNDKEIKDILDCGSDGLIDIKKAEQMLKDKNT